MKGNKILKSLLIIPFVILSGCNDFLDINDTPNNPLVVPPSTLLSNMLVGAAFTNANELNRFSSTVMDYTAGASGNPRNYDIYVTNGADFGNQWRFELYGGAITSGEKLIAAAIREESKVYAGIAKIMKAYSFSLATDVWGDVPYSEAGKGDPEGILQPRIDKQEDIYKGNASLKIQSLFDLIREGIVDLDATSLFKPASDDVVYGGDISKWKKAGYSLMLKLALTISDREPDLATSVINEVIAAGQIITLNNENLSVKFGSATGSQSPIHSWTNVSSFRNDMMVSTGYVSLLQGLNDPRLAKFVTKPTGNFITIANGFRGTLPTPATNWSRWGAAVTGAGGVGPVRLLTAAQVAFILAEAKLILPAINTPGGKTANDLYRDGINASMAEAGVATADVTAYLATAAGTLTGTTEQQREQIILQKYIAGTGNGLEAWNDYRRTGYPAFAEHQNAGGKDSKRPRRAHYIDHEVQRNPAFSPAVATNVNVWWGVK